MPSRSPVTFTFSQKSLRSSAISSIAVSTLLIASTIESSDEPVSDTNRTAFEAAIHGHSDMRLALSGPEGAGASVMGVTRSVA